MYSENVITAQLLLRKVKYIINFTEKKLLPFTDFIYLTLKI